MWDVLIETATVTIYVIISLILSGHRLIVGLIFIILVYIGTIFSVGFMNPIDLLAGVLSSQLTGLRFAWLITCQTLGVVIGFGLWKYLINRRTLRVLAGSLPPIYIPKF